MKIISWNVNGLRSIYGKNFLGWLREASPDILCVQETKAEEIQLPSELAKIAGYHSCFNSARKKGYSGVAVYSKARPLGVETRIGMRRFDDEGRLLRLDYPSFSLINVYIPQGGRQKENMEYKLDAFRALLGYAKKINGNSIIMGDFNVAHTALDLARPKQNENNTMFTPGEREQISKMISAGFLDAFREFHSEGGNYSWWPYFADARQRNLGWRIDYAFVSRGLRPALRDAFILSEAKGSDHCPIGIGLEFG